MTDSTQNKLSSAVNDALAQESPAAILAGRAVAKIMVATAKHLGKAWGQMREVFEPLSIDEAKEAAKLAREEFSEWAKAAGITDKAASVYLSEFIRCKFNGREIPESRKGFKEYLKDKTFVKMTNAGARVKGGKPSDNAGENGNPPAGEGDEPAVKGTELPNQYLDIVNNVKLAAEAGLNLDAISKRIAALLDSMIEDAIALAELDDMEQAEVDADETTAIGWDVAHTGTEG